jgi:hypothetical protein
MKVSGNSLIVLTAHQRKGFNPEERDVEIILAIHNVVNEKGEAVGFARSAHLVSSQAGNRSRSGRRSMDGSVSSFVIVHLTSLSVALLLSLCVLWVVQLTFHPKPICGAFSGTLVPLHPLSDL